LYRVDPCAPAPVRDIARKAQTRLCDRHRKLVADRSDCGQCTRVLLLRLGDRAGDASWMMSAPATSRPISKPGCKLQMIDDAVTDQDLRVPPSNHFAKLRDNLAGFHSIRVNQQWCLIFRWDGERGEADGIHLDDHGYR
jgi:plasmid maintenance system killer protein